MKKLTLILTLFLFVAACDENVSLTDPEPIVSKPEQAIQILEKQGFTYENYVIEGNNIGLKDGPCVQWFEIDDVIENSDETLDKSQQWRHRYYASQFEASTIEVNLGNLNSRWRNAVISAVNSWNAVTNTKVSMRITSGTGSRVDIFCRRANFSGGTVASAFFPTSSGNVRGTIRFDNGYGNSLSTATLHMTAIHEIGHAMGWRHINNNESGRVRIPGTPLTDSQSVMNPTVNSNNRFSFYDRVAMRVLWP